MTGELLKYDEACRAVAEAKTIDEAHDLANKAEAVRIYARQAKNRQMEFDAAEIRFRAERRLGELLRSEKENGLISKGGRPLDEARSPDAERRMATLAELGIARKLSADAQRLAGLPAPRFERLIVEWRERATEEGLHVSTRLINHAEKRERRAAEGRRASGPLEQFVGLDGRSIANWKIGELASLEAKTREQSRVARRDPLLWFA